MFQQNFFIHLIFLYKRKQTMSCFAYLSSQPFNLSKNYTYKEIGRYVCEFLCEFHSLLNKIKDESLLSKVIDF